LSACLPRTHPSSAAAATVAPCVKRCVVPFGVVLRPARPDYREQDIASMQVRENLGDEIVAGSN
jgi:hypothetical protein